MLTYDIEKVAATGLREVGQSENPRNSNLQKYGKWYGMNGVAWCAIFISWIFWHAGEGLPAIRTKKGFAFCPDLQQWAINNGTYHTGTRGIKRGDILLFSFGGVRVDHVAFVLGVLPDGRIHTLEGNTNDAGSRTGGMVMEKYRRSGIHGYVEVKNKNKAIDWSALRRHLAGSLRIQLGNCKDLGPDQKNCEVAVLQQSLNLVTGSTLKVDGYYGKETKAVVLNFQKFMNKAKPGTIKDYPGSAANETRWWLCTSLDRIRDGQA